MEMSCALTEAAFAAASANYFVFPERV